jgi:hypothetical protein
MSGVPPGIPETVYKGHRFALRDDDEGFEMWIDGRSWGHMADRLGPQRYGTHLLPFTEFPTADAMARAVIDRAGEAWVAVDDDRHPHPHPHDHGQDEPPE